MRSSFSYEIEVKFKLCIVYRHTGKSVCELGKESVPCLIENIIFRHECCFYSSRICVYCPVTGYATNL